MPRYRVFAVTERGQLRRIAELDCVDDAEIVRQVSAFKQTGLVEIWLGARLVKRFEIGAD